MPHLSRLAYASDSGDYVEPWIEKDALAGVVYDVTAPYDVRLMVTKGYASLSFLHEAAQAFEEHEKDVYVYFFGDHDPSGVDIARTTEERFRQFAPGTMIFFQKVAIYGVAARRVVASDPADEEDRHARSRVPWRQRGARCATA
jgi:hypothetical protein